MIVVNHKPAHIDNMARIKTDTIYLTTCNRPVLFKNFKET